MKAETRTIEYEDQTVRWFTIASITWGAVAMLVGVIIATQLNFWRANFNLEWLTFGRLRPLHTNAAIFAFVGNMMFAGIYYSTQRLCKAPTASLLLSKIHFWGWQLIIVAAAITLPLGFSRSKEYAELIWPINLAVAFIWLVFAANFFLTLKRRNEPSLYVALWFYIATIVTVTLLYVVNHLQIPTSLTHSYPIFGGVQDALVQWWYGHNAVAFFLTTPILGIMYYFLPKAADRPVYSYRLSVVHFWSLVFIYIWAGPHHLLNTALPNWLQGLGMTFSLMLWAPSWGGMLNGLLTLRGAWDKVRQDPVLKFFVVAVTFYGMATFEGPLLAIRAVNSLSHYSDWTIGHVHSGTLGWNGFMAAGMFYWMVPKLWGKKLHSVPLANMHFWLGLVGILLYVGAMWASGVTQGLMLNATDASGEVLRYPVFLETLQVIKWPMLFRAIGGLFFLIGWFMLAYNLTRTIRAGAPVVASQEVTIVTKEKKDELPLGRFLNSDPFLAVFGGILCGCAWIFLDWMSSWVALGLTLFFAVLIVMRFKNNRKEWVRWYDRLSENWMPFTVITLIAIAIGGVIQIVPTVTVNRAENIEDRLQVPYTPLELAGRDIYVSEGCYNCHSQMIRTLLPDVLRYGDYSRIGESIYDFPHQWGSKRTGPDLARVGKKYPDSWHYSHMLDPRSMSPGSNMPAYPWLFEKNTDIKALPKKIAVQTQLGVPYPAMTQHEIEQGALEQAAEISTKLAETGLPVESTKQIVALIAYLQKLGTWEVPPEKTDDAEDGEGTPEAAPATATTAAVQ